MAWGRGWARARGVHTPVDVPGGWWAEVGLPGHRERHVLHTWDARRLARVEARPGTWIKVIGRRDDLRAALPREWAMDEDGFLMTTRLGAAAAPAPAGYRVEVTTDGPVTRAAALDTTGTVAAAAHLAATGEFAIFDRVTTEPAHQRRGLGTAVMTALDAHAVRAGLTTGLLAASDQGRRLYERLGWTTRGLIAAARIPEDREES